MNTCNDIIKTMLSMANPQKAKELMRFFKTGKGEYAEGDKFLGICNPQTRLVVKEAWKETSIEEAVKIATNEWHEIRLCGILILVALFEKAAKKKDFTEMKLIYDEYLKLHPYINNWDLVDLSAPRIVGGWELQNGRDPLMDKWIKPNHSIWQKRIAIVSCWLTIRNNIYTPALERAKELLCSKEDLLHKATGWMLREVGKHDGMELLLSFLEENIHQMPSTMLRYAIEKFDEPQRQLWLKRRREK